LTKEIAKLPLFADLLPATLQKLEFSSNIKNYSFGDILFYENDKNGKLHYIIEGGVKVYKVDRYDNEIFLYNLYGGEFIAEFGSLESISCFANVEFIRDSKVLIIDINELKNLMSGDAVLMSKMFDLFIQRVRRLQCIINREVVFDGIAKVAHLIQNDLTFFNESKKQQIAQMLNIQPETLSRILKKLERNGAIESSGKIKILDEKKLREIYE